MFQSALKEKRKKENENMLVYIRELTIFAFKSNHRAREEASTVLQNSLVRMISFPVL